MTLRSREQEAFSQALRKREPLLALRDALREFLSAGATRENLLRELQDFRYEVRKSRNPQNEDVVLDAMDIVEGWVSPHMRV
jgi:hypothetical protein